MLKGTDFIKGNAQIISPQEIRVNENIIQAKSIIIAAGSGPSELKILPFDHKKIISSDDLLNIKEIPSSLLVVGGGVVGCEFASLFNMLGSQVEIVEKLPQLLPGQDDDVAKKLENLFKKKGIKVNTSADVSTLDLSGYALVLVCVGRSTRTEGLNLEGLGVKTEKNAIVVDDYLRTSVENIYAAGDCTGRIMLAHYAAYQGTLVVENLIHPQAMKKADNQTVPSCIFTDPEVASTGLSENSAKEKGMDIEVHKFDFMGSGMGRILGETDGFIKIISERKTGLILGASIIGPRATELISIISLGAASKLTLGQLKDVIFPHPTISEGIAEAVKKSDAV